MSASEMPPPAVDPATREAVRMWVLVYESMRFRLTPAQDLTYDPQPERIPTFLQNTRRSEDLALQ